MTRYDVAAAEDIGPGQMKGFSAGGQRVLVANLDGEWLACDELCPHLCVPLSRGRLEDDCLTCPGHGSQFDLRTGQPRKWLGRKPGLLSTLADGRPQPLTRYPVQVEAGRVFVDV